MVAHGTLANHCLVSHHPGLSTLYQHSDQEKQILQHLLLVSLFIFQALQRQNMTPFSLPGRLRDDGALMIDDNATTSFTLPVRTRGDGASAIDGNTTSFCLPVRMRGDASSGIDGHAMTTPCKRTLLTLPEELRTEIYRYAVTIPPSFKVVPTEQEPTVSVQGHLLEHSTGEAAQRRIHPSAPALAMTCKEVRAEVLPIHYGENLFDISAMASTNRAVTLRRIRHWRNHLGTNAKLLCHLQCAIFARSAWYRYSRHGRRTRGGIGDSRYVVRLDITSTGEYEARRYEQSTVSPELKVWYSTVSPELLKDWLSTGGGVTFFPERKDWSTTVSPDAKVWYCSCDMYSKVTTGPDVKMDGNRLLDLLEGVVRDGCRQPVQIKQQCEKCGLPALLM